MNKHQKFTDFKLVVRLSINMGCRGDMKNIIKVSNKWLKFILDALNKESDLPALDEPYTQYKQNVSSEDKYECFYFAWSISG